MGGFRIHKKAKIQVADKKISEIYANRQGLCIYFHDNISVSKSRGTIFPAYFFFAVCLALLQRALAEYVAWEEPFHARTRSWLLAEQHTPSMNWFKRLSLSSQTQQQHNNSTPHNSNTTQTIPTLHPEPARPAATRELRPNKTMQIGLRSVSAASTSPNPLLFQQDRDIVDPASPLSILAATSKLTTFPYGELQALNARVHLETPKLAVIGVNGTSNSVAELNGVAPKQSVRANPVARDPPANNSVVVQQRQKLRSRDRITSIPPAKPLLPSPMPPPHPPPATTSSIPTPVIQSAFDDGKVGDAVISSKTAASQRPLRNLRSVTAPTLLPKTRSMPISYPESPSLSSTLNTRRTKRLKTEHETADPTPALANIPSQPTPETPPPANKRRVLPARQGHIDILDGEISLLGTPQRLDSPTPSYSSSF
jgi:hypothetical protein